MTLLIRTHVGDLRATQSDSHRKWWKTSHPFTRPAPSYEKGARTDSWRILLRARGLKTWDDKRMREPIWTNPHSGEDYLRLWCSHRFHEANIKATAGGKGQAETHEDNSRKGMRNAISVIKTEPRLCVCFHVHLYPPTQLSSLLNFKGNVLVNSAGELFWTDILYSSKLKPLDEFRSPLIENILKNANPIKELHSVSIWRCSWNFSSLSAASFFPGLDVNPLGWVY